MGKKESLGRSRIKESEGHSMGLIREGVNWRTRALALLLCFFLPLALLPALPPSSPPCLAATISSQPDPDFWATDRDVYVVLSTPDTVYIRGQFPPRGPQNRQRCTS